MEERAQRRGVAHEVAAGVRAAFADTSSHGIMELRYMIR
jgi:hypothetical protein